MVAHRWQGMRRRASPLVLAMVLFGRPGGAQSVGVPIGLQVELLSRVAAYDRSLPERANGRVRVVILTKAGSAESASAAARLKSAFSSLPPIVGLPHEELVADFTNAPAVAEMCRAQRVSVLYVTEGLGDEIEAIRRALEGVSVLTVSTVPEYVSRGIVLGFDVVSGKPKLLVHLTQSRKQKVALSADVLKIMTVIQ